MDRKKTTDVKHNGLEKRRNVYFDSRLLSATWEVSCKYQYSNTLDPPPQYPNFPEDKELWSTQWRTLKTWDAASQAPPRAGSASSPARPPLKRAEPMAGKGGWASLPPRKASVPMCGHAPEERDLSSARAHSAGQPSEFEPQF